MNNSRIEYLRYCKEKYREDLLHNIIPFWMTYGVDKVNGGVYTCVDRDGGLMDTTKSVWFQGRFGFVCSYIYNNVEKDPKLLEASKSCIDFIEKYCSDEDGHMYFTVTEDGKPVQKRRYVFSECFAIMAMAEYSKATGSKEYADKALSLFKLVRRMLDTPGYLPAKTTVEGRSHSITMILMNVALTLQEVVSDPALDKQIDDSIYDIEHYFMHPEYKALLETVDPDGRLIDTLAGRVINPGHCIETAWFLMEVARKRNDKHVNDLALTILDWSVAWGWDEEFGGIINFKDCKNFPPQDYSQDMKFWWPQCETIIAALYAYRISGDEKYLDLHQKANDWAYQHLADDEFGEWFGYLHRDGSVAQPAKGNIFKGPFHIPRMMVRSHLLCAEILENEN